MEKKKYGDGGQGEGGGGGGGAASTYKKYRIYLAHNSAVNAPLLSLLLQQKFT